jgi:hypothetical protein
MSHVVARLIAIVGLSLMLSSCTAGTPTPSPTSTAAVDHTVQALIDGEWVLTRTVSSTDDPNNPARVVGTVSTRALLFSEVDCAKGPCTGKVASGPTAAVRDSTEFESSGNTIAFEFSGYLNCLKPADGTVLVANGFTYHSRIELTVADADEAGRTPRATSLEGRLHYTDTITNEALSAGCTREPAQTTTEYTLTAVRATAK